MPLLEKEEKKKTATHPTKRWLRKSLSFQRYKISFEKFYETKWFPCWLYSLMNVIHPSCEKYIVPSVLNSEWPQIQNVQRRNNGYMQGVKVGFLFKVITVLFLCSLVPKTKWICSPWPNFCQDPDTWRAEWVSSWWRSYWGFLEPWKAWAGEAFGDHETTLYL